MHYVRFAILCVCSSCQTRWISPIDVVLRYCIALASAFGAEGECVTNGFIIFIWIDVRLAIVRWQLGASIRHSILIEMPTSTSDKSLCPCELHAFMYWICICVRFVLRIAYILLMHQLQRMTCTIFASARTSFERNRLCFAHFISLHIVFLWMCRRRRHEKQLFPLNGSNWEARIPRRGMKSKAKQIVASKHRACTKWSSSWPSSERSE